MPESLPTFESGPEALQWKRLKRLNLTGARLEYLTRVTPIDRFLAATALPLIPRSISPNRITVFRFLSIPFVVLLLFFEYSLAGTILFVLSAFSDALDGARARTEHRITKWGIVADPIADKMLIGSVALLLMPSHMGWPLTLVIVSLELTLAASAYFRYSGKLMPAKAAGKIKMILESFGLGFLLLFVNSGVMAFLAAAEYSLYGAVFFALVSLFVYRSI